MSSFYTNFFLRGPNVYCRRVDNGIHSLDKFPADPELYVPTTDEPDGYTIHGEPLARVSFDTPKDAREFIKSYESANMPLYGFPKFQYTAIHKTFPGTIDAAEAFKYLTIMSIDIETTVNAGFPNIFTANEQITLITAGVNGVYHTFGYKPITSNIESNYSSFDTEDQLLKAFIKFYKSVNPHVLTGWNIRGFDLPFMYNRIANKLGETAPKFFSPYGFVEKKQTHVMGKEALELKIDGVAVLDYLDLYQKFIPDPRENYKLDTIAKIEVNEQKLEHPGSFKDHYENHWDNFVLYNIQDTKLVDKLEAKLKLIQLAVTVSYIAKVNFDDVFATTRVWDSIIANHLYDSNTHAPAVFNNSSAEGYEGAFVKPTLPGYYKWVMSFDIESLYPMLIVQYNISPETILDSRLFFDLNANDVLQNTHKFQRAAEQAKELEASLCANGAMFSNKKQGFLPFLTDKVFQDRKMNKKEMTKWKKELELVKDELQKRGLSNEV